MVSFKGNSAAVRALKVRLVPVFPAILRWLISVVGKMYKQSSALGKTTDAF
jgi:hypothetical protein